MQCNKNNEALLHSTRGTLYAWHIGPGVNWQACPKAKHATNKLLMQHNLNRVNNISSYRAQKLAASCMEMAPMPTANHTHSPKPLQSSNRALLQHGRVLALQPT
jgi:hypothetical protein